MALTHARAEAVLLGMVRGWYEEVQFDVTHVDGTNADLDEPLRVALIGMNLAPADVASLADTDFLAIAGANYERFFAYAELAALYRVQGSLVGFTFQSGTYKASHSDQSLALERVITSREARIAKQWGSRGGGCSIGRLVSDRNCWGYPRALGDPQPLSECDAFGRFVGKRVIDDRGPFNPLPESLW